jgi:hypothetical protein
VNLPVKSRLVLIVLLSIGAGVRVGGQAAGSGYTVSEAVFLPPQFYVGDRVELRLRLETDEALRLEPIELVAEKEWLVVEEVRVQPRGPGEAEVRIFFISFYPGNTRLPPLRLGDALLTDIGISTLSALEKEDASQLRGPREQLALPGTYLKLAAILLAAVAVPLLAFLLSRRLLRAARKLRSLRLWRRPYLQAKRELRRLQQELPDMASRGFFIRLSRLLKAYLSERLSLPVLSRTTRELAVVSPPPIEWEEVMSVLELSDLVKFSEHSSPAAEMAGTLKRVSDLIERLEEESGHVEP